jgi:hypothetical protein
MQAQQKEKTNSQGGVTLVGFWLPDGCGCSAIEGASSNSHERPVEEKPTEKENHA